MEAKLMGACEYYFLKLTCPNRAGIVAAVSTCITQSGGDIIESAQFDDQETNIFLMRVYFSAPDPESLSIALDEVKLRFNADLQLIPQNHKGRVLIMVSKMDHCLHDLLYRWKKKGLNMELVAIVSNHMDTEPLTKFYGLPFYYLPVDKDNKAQQEAELYKIIETEAVDLVVLARYMQILSNALSSKLYGRVINIHHSFLPSFKGAKPYHRAHKRGVKLIGATAHYVTPDLDEGPIIEQEVTRVKHSDTPEDLVRIGRDTESRVLARAVKWHLEHRVFLNGDKTVIFN